MTKKEKNLQVKILTDSLLDAAKDFSPRRYREHAYEELAEIEKLTGKSFLYIALVLEEYPDFDNVLIIATQPNEWIIKYYLEPHFMINNPEAVKAIAALMVNITE